MKRTILDFTLPEFEAEIQRLGHPAYRAKQVFDWIYRQGSRSFDEMKNLPRALATELARGFDIAAARVLDTARDITGKRGTSKHLIEFAGGARAETVCILEGARRTVCLSAQSGCPVGCVFCASGAAGLVRSLTSGEMIQQVLLFEEGTARTVTNVVIMGMGEPLLNYDQTVKFVRCATAPWGLALSARRITLSTVGIVKGIERLAGEDLKINLAISLHAPDDRLRSRLVSRNEGVDEIIAAARKYFERTKREVTFEYVLIGGVNSGEKHARALARKLRDVRCSVNVIAYNPVPEVAPELQRPDPATVRSFVGTLRNCGINATLRKSRGGAINAACGQLRLRSLKNAKRT
ncbi:MAG: 23S rRNA (adenine(2503)-C(2))-methyltransferase RlmN [Planctomycetota bacterium]